MRRSLGCLAGRQKFLSSAEKKSERKQWEAKFKQVMIEQRFMPGGRTLAIRGLLITSWRIVL